jgi:DNA adenine methylase
MRTDTVQSGAAPFLRWAGSKRSVLGQLLRVLPENFGKYIEPFAGSACLFFRISPNRSVLGDLNHDLIETYKIVRETPGEVASALQEMPVGKDEFYRVREADARILSEIEKAARFIYLNRFCFNGLYRTNSKGQFNVPYGAPKTHRVPTKADLEAVVRGNARSGDLVYLDPPFFRHTVRVFREYNAEPFGASDLDRLATLLRWLNSRGVTFCLSYADCTESRLAFAEWPSLRISTNRNISGFAKHRRRARELVVTNSGLRR